jgi:hypothetical protein
VAAQFEAGGCNAPYPPEISPDQVVDSVAPVPFQPAFPEHTNLLNVCGGHVAYIGVNPTDLLFEHCNTTTVTCPSTDPADRFSHIGYSIPFFQHTSDWLFALMLKNMGYDPNHMTVRWCQPAAPCPQAAPAP